MRVPTPIVALLCPIAIGITWWLGTRDKDFLTPPPGLVIPDVTPTVVPTPPPKETTTPQKDEPPVTLDTFADQAAMGPAHLIQLANGLEEAKFHHLAWLAWERVLDATSASAAETTQARTAIRRLRTLPGDDRVEFPTSPLPITLQAGTARKHVAAIQPLLEETARQLETASSGILRVRALVTGGSNPTQPTTQSPVAIWISGPDTGSRSSEVLSFTLRPGLDAKERIHSSTSELLRSLIARSLTPPPPAPKDMPFPEELAECITRRAWLTIGTHLNLPIEENP
jgi:hypothetical protein